jgi:hypothetical protein
LIRGLQTRFHECGEEKNSTLIRHDILRALREVYDTIGDMAIREVAQALIQTEDDPKYQAKYQGLWKNT